VLRSDQKWFCGVTCGQANVPLSRHSGFIQRSSKDAPPNHPFHTFTAMQRPLGFPGQQTQTTLKLLRNVYIHREVYVLKHADIKDRL